jgi:large subunit ribosomal protein L18
MSKLNFNRRKNRVRYKLKKNTSRHRLSVFVSNSHIYAQLIDDLNSNTVLSSSSLQLKAKSINVEIAKKVGSDIANKAKKAKIKEVVFDRSAYLYHGRVKALASAARENGLVF